MLTLLRQLLTTNDGLGESSNFTSQQPRREVFMHAIDVLELGQSLALLGVVERDPHVVVIFRVILVPFRPLGPVLLDCSKHASRSCTMP